MQLKIEVKKRHLYLITALIVALFGIVLVLAVKPNPGHTSAEIEFLEDFTTCKTIVGPTSIGGTVGWTAINVPQNCRGRPCKLIMVIYKSGASGPVVTDLKVTDYYQAEYDSDSTKEYWEIYGRSISSSGNNGDTSESTLLSAQTGKLALRDDETTISETDKFKWSYQDNANSYGMAIQTCNY